MDLFSFTAERTEEIKKERGQEDGGVCVLRSGNTQHKTLLYEQIGEIGKAENEKDLSLADKGSKLIGGYKHTHT